MEVDFFDDILECPVCLKTLDQNNKVLPCQHTFCTACVEQIVKSQKQLCCPECRIMVKKSVNELPSNIMLIRILDGLRVKEMTKSKKMNKSVPSKVKPPNPNQLKTTPPHHHRTAISPSEVGSATQPMCVASYDFLKDSRTYYDPDCLNFKKNDCITVIRQIDPHWAEGKLNGKIGIFPLSYVQLNDAAKRLTKEQKPDKNDFRVHEVNKRIHSKPKQLNENYEKIGALKRRSFPVEKNVTTIPIRGGREIKPSLMSRHSAMLTPVIRTKDGRQILSEAKSSTSRVTNSSATTSNAPPQPHMHLQRTYVQSHHHPDIKDINFVIAVYPYKPQKLDELELIKGNRYQVIEVCNDGWCKGKHEPSNKHGVFPGNYTQPVGPGKECLLKSAPFHWASPPKQTSKQFAAPVAERKISTFPRSPPTGGKSISASSHERTSQGTPPVKNPDKKKKNSTEDSHSTANPFKLKKAKKVKKGKTNSRENKT